VEAQGNRQFAGARGRVVAGMEFGRQAVDSVDPNGSQTVYDRKRSTQYGSVFGQVEYRLAPRLNTVASARWDRSTLHDGRVSPRVAAVYGLTPTQTLRMSYGRAFQVANLTASFLNIAVAPAIDLSPVEAALAPVIGNTSLGLKNVPILAVGNDSLRVERIDSAEIGYQAIIGGRLLVNAGLYRNQLKDFISNILPQIGTSLGRLNPSFGPYRPPSSLSPAARQSLHRRSGVCCRRRCLRRCPMTPAERRSSRCCPSSTLGRRQLLGWNSAQPTFCQPAGGHRGPTPDSIRV
jgi:outer membrane receptor protein involved in Fe transport